MTIKNCRVFEEALLIISNKGGKCLTKFCKNQYVKITIECDKGHIWTTAAKSIKHNHWCRICSQIKNSKARKYRKGIDKTPLYNLNDIQKIAKNKNGKCLSDKYQQRLKFECGFGHQWEATVSNIVGSNSWCPICSSSLYERICRLYFETIFGKKFPTSYPKWLKNKKGKQLELDGYCEELNIAFEHNGKQHYNKINFYGKSNEFKKLQQNDKEKKSLCNKYGTKLIIIPELFSMTKIEDLKQFIYDQCLKLGINLPKNYNNIIIDYNLVYLSNKEKENFTLLKERFLNKGYELLSKNYLGINVKYEIKCIKCGNIRNSFYYSVLKDVCSSCSGRNNNITIKDCIDLAFSKNGKCLSTKYVSSSAKLLWQCEFGHKWKTSYRLIKHNETWCPKCYILHKGEDLKLPISEYKEVAIKKGGECLSNEVNSCRDYLEWKCDKGHTWLAQGYVIKNSANWCPECARLRRCKKPIQRYIS